jgi:hypothetical protein
MRRLGWLFLAVAGCGGKAVIDAPLGDGGSDATNGSGAGASPNSSVAVTTSVSTGPTIPACATACASIGVCLIDESACISACAAATAGCGAEQRTWLDCVVATHLGGCTIAPGSPCLNQLVDFLACRNELPVAGDCTIGPDGCQCVESSVSSDFGALCTPTSQGMTCDCFLDGTLVGRCDQTNEECLPTLDCCAAILFVPGP